MYIFFFVTHHSLGDISRFDKRHEVSSLVKIHQNTHNFVKYEIKWKCQITLANMEYQLNNTYVFLVELLQILKDISKYWQHHLQSQCVGRVDHSEPSSFGWVALFRENCNGRVWPDIQRGITSCTETDYLWYKTRRKGTVIRLRLCIIKHQKAEMNCALSAPHR